ncbi:hypothetical protein PHMEG_0005485 [Phytophthora megakarya]|uniref:Purple acid phosphatase C-terminal domain-containing protein n=1 Tax=Phytophthora megakarya TaxID=4795 RepID=A0A225WR95_9STRA|nr:hypothetical protein PHMEG_0005485 [Phytophthora megakarya]
MTWGHVEVVKWLIRRFPSGQVRSNAVAQAAKNGHLQVLQWLFNHHDHVFWGGDEMYFAVGNNRLQVAKFLHEYTTPPSDDRFLIDEAARHGDLDMMQWLHTERGDRLTYEGVTRAVDCGFLEAVKWMKDTFPRDVRINEIKMDNAAANGHLDMVKWLHTQQAWCTKQAMNPANGHLNMVQWLHENRTEGCTQYAVDTAAKKGYLYVMKWLYANRHEGCSRDAMDSAAAGGRLEIVQWLHAHYAVEVMKEKDNTMIFCIYHTPMYTIRSCDMDGKPNNDFEALNVQQAFENLFTKYKVDLVLQGHVHAYERQYPTANGSAVMDGVSKDDATYTNPKAPVYVISGSAGGPEGLYKYKHPESPKWHVLMNNKNYAITKMAVTPTSITLTTIETATGTVCDKFSIVKDNQGFSQVR